MSETIEHYKIQISQARAEIKNLRQQMYALRNEHLKEIKTIKSTLSGFRCSNCGNTAPTFITATQPSPTESEALKYKPIGFIETAFHNKRGVPRQPTVCNQSNGTVVIKTSVFNNPEHALDGLEEFSHMWIIFHFHMTESTNSPAKVSPPRLRGERRGVFATRSPHRPCPIGLSLVRIERIEGNKIHFIGVDMVNGTPVLDIKPYIPQYDYPTIEDAQMSMRPTTVGDSETRGVADMRLSDCSAIPGQSSVDSNVSTPDNPCDTRGTPDGQERFTPPHRQIASGISHDGIRIAPWIYNPPAQTYNVRFTDEALARLHSLIGDRAEQFRSNIESLLSEDPRSKYVRTKYGDHEYSCLLEDVSISCMFDSASLVCTIHAVRSADELRDTEM